MLIKVIKTTLGAKCQKGISVKEYLEGETYDIFEELAQVFIKEGWGMEIKEENKDKQSESEKKAVADTTIENKAIAGAPENKLVKKPVLRGKK